MLPDFPIIKGKVQEALNRYARSLAVASSQVLSQIHHITHYEGNRFDGFSQEGPGEHTYSSFEHRVVVDTSELISSGPDYFATRMPEIIAPMTTQVETSFFATFRKAVQLSGNEVDAEGQRLTPELLLSVYGKMDLEFDEQGKPIFLTLMVNPSSYERAKACFNQIDSNPDYHGQFEALIEKKRAEWHNRESSRRLVD